MANTLPLQHNLSYALENIIVAVEDPWNAWPLLKDSFQARLPIKKALLNNKTRNPVTVERLPVDYIPSTDIRLKSRPSLETSPSWWFRHPYAALIIVVCEDLDEYKVHVKQRLRNMVINDRREWIILYVTKLHANDPAVKIRKRVYARLEDDFNMKKRERCCKLDLFAPEASAWEEIELKIVECIRNCLDLRVQFYEEEVRKLSENRFTSGWNFYSFFVVKESLAFMFEMAQLREEALREYDELEQCYMEVVNGPNNKDKNFGGGEEGDERAALLEHDRKLFSKFATQDRVQEFDFRQYLFARQALLLFALNRPAEVAERGLTFILTFSKSLANHERALPFCLKELWVYSACMDIAKASAERFVARNMSMQVEKEFYRLQADLFSHARSKLMRLGDLIGYGASIERSPCNSAQLSMSPWPKPAAWPPLPPDSEDRVQAMKALIQQEVTGGQLPLAPIELLPDGPHGAFSADQQRQLDGMSADHGRLSPSRITSSPERGFQRRRAVTVSMLAEMRVAAEAALAQRVTHEGLRKALSSSGAFEEAYLELTRIVADNFHRAVWKRHGLSFDAEVAAVHFRRGNLDSAVKGYEKLASLLSTEEWSALHFTILPRLAQCQKALGDMSNYLASCVKLLSLEEGLVPEQERVRLQEELCDISQGGLREPMSLEVSALITYACASRTPLELCEGDPGQLEIIVWSGFPQPLMLDSLSIALVVPYTIDETPKSVKSVEPPVLSPGINRVSLALTPQKQGSYILGPLLALMSKAKLRSNSHSLKGGPPDSDDHLSVERIQRPVLQVAAARPLVEVSVIVSWGLLLAEPQWVGILIRPFDYSLKGAILTLSLSSGLQMDDPQLADLEPHTPHTTHTPPDTPRLPQSPTSSPSPPLPPAQQVEIRNGSVTLPDWAAEIATVLWIRVTAQRDEGAQPFASSATALSPPPSPGMQTPAGMTPRLTRSSVSSSSATEHHHPRGGLSSPSGAVSPEGVRSLHVKLAYGAECSRTYERSIPLHFTEPFRAITRVVSKGNDGTLLLQVTLRSQVCATLTVVNGTLSLQSGFAHSPSDPRASSTWLLPLPIYNAAEGALLFTVGPETSARSPSPARPSTPPSPTHPEGRSSLRVEYRVDGHRSNGAHAPVTKGEGGAEREGEEEGVLGGGSAVFTHYFVLQKPVLERMLAVGLLPLPSDLPARVGEPLLLHWRVERLVQGRAVPSADGSASTDLDQEEELLYEVKAAMEHWMIAGRRKGRLGLMCHVGARTVITLACVPIVSGHIHPPALRLPQINRGHISHSPAGPHLVCVLPPAVSSSFCVAKTLVPPT